ncbi:4Fe-4S dicluster domain-containing protein [Peptoclostridium litorale DSM 5388]|uniref:Ferredoxin n=1 Tax=Peptoclostridium litorale DSM 5388 TaxID=1121324 RepID=A0A069RCW2_PEPLI|nr:2Fe-2S iron-sulfur cluster-binding protein [Peptoclostridium litorale]KDR94861.1 NADH-quinone oxidoreductase subunit G 2 [Peptoclostridium litorale DSM 5388]SIN94323.1 4Fe-4S dicluster domain-containing protein [Peptoclostridium litorale DSM 5388]
MKSIELVIDGKQVVVPDNYTIIKAAEKLGIEIPALCYDPSLEIVASCRLCVVEVEGLSGLQTACSTKVCEGMVVSTKTQKVIAARRMILQLFLDNHPNDCLTCQKAGECLLQKYAYEYDVKFSEQSSSISLKIDDSNPYVLRDESKCILCGKCVRVCEQVEERAVLSFANRGIEMKVVADDDRSMGNSSCVSCQRCISVCPVGALMDARNMNKYRSWELEKEEIRCSVCQYGCSFEILKKGSNIVGVRAMAPGGGRPLCLKGRLANELNYVDMSEIAPVYVKRGQEYVQTTWTQALALNRIVNRLKMLDGKE